MTTPGMSPAIGEAPNSDSVPTLTASAASVATPVARRQPPPEVASNANSATRVYPTPESPAKRANCAGDR